MRCDHRLADHALLRVAQDVRDGENLHLHDKRRSRVAEDEGRDVRLGEHAVEHQHHVRQRNERDGHNIPSGHRQAHVRRRRLGQHELSIGRQLVLCVKTPDLLYQRLRLCERRTSPQPLRRRVEKGRSAEP